MSQNKQMLLSSAEMEVGPLFANELYRIENIPEPTFSFGMHGYTDDEASFVDFGKPDEFRVQGAEISQNTTVTFGFNDDFFWSTWTQAIKFSENLEYAIEGSPYTIFDTGSSHLMVPPLLLEPIVEGLIAATGNRAQYAVQQGITFVDCNQRGLFKPLSFMYTEYYIEIDPEDYIWDVNGDGQVCTLLIIANSYDFFLLGQPVYQKYYTIHDMRRATIGYAALRNTNKEIPQRASIPNEIMIASTPPTFLELYGNFIFVMACVLLAAYVIQPELEKHWDINSEADRNNFIAVYVAYGCFCLFIFVFIVQPALSLPSLDLGQQRFYVVTGLFSSLASTLKLSQMKAATRKTVAAEKPVVAAKPTVEHYAGLKESGTTNQLI